MFLYHLGTYLILDEQSRFTDCALMCKENGNKRCLSDSPTFKCGCPDTFIERDGVCWEIPPQNDKQQQSSE